jgi:hypothetical protein
MITNPNLWVSDQNEGKKEKEREIVIDVPIN